MLFLVHHSVSYELYVVWYLFILLFFFLNEHSFFQLNKMSQRMPFWIAANYTKIALHRNSDIVSKMHLMKWHINCLWLLFWAMCQNAKHPPTSQIMCVQLNNRCHRRISKRIPESPHEILNRHNLISNAKERTIVPTRISLKMFYFSKKNSFKKIERELNWPNVMKIIREPEKELNWVIQFEQ